MLPGHVSSLPSLSSLSLNDPMTIDARRALSGAIHKSKKPKPVKPSTEVKYRFPDDYETEFIGLLSEGLDTANLSILNARQLNPNNEEYLLWAISSALDKVWYGVDDDGTTASIWVRWRNKSIYPWHLDMTMHNWGVYDLRRDVTKLICNRLHVPPYEPTVLADSIKKDMNFSTKVSFIVEIYASLFVTHFDKRMHTGIEKKIKNDWSSIAMELVSLSGHALDWFPQFKDEDEFILTAAETSRKWARVAIIRLVKILAEYETGIANEDAQAETNRRLTRDWGVFLNRMIHKYKLRLPDSMFEKNAVHVKHQMGVLTDFQKQELEISDLLRTTADLYMSLYSDDPVIVHACEAIMEAMYHKGAAGFIADIQEATTILDGT